MLRIPSRPRNCRHFIASVLVKNQYRCRRRGDRTNSSDLEARQLNIVTCYPFGEPYYLAIKPVDLTLISTWIVLLGTCTTSRLFNRTSTDCIIQVAWCGGQGAGLGIILNLFERRPPLEVLQDSILKLGRIHGNTLASRVIRGNPSLAVRGNLYHHLITIND